MLVQAIEDMVQYYRGQALPRMLLCFRVFLHRTDTVSAQDKEVVEERLHMFNQLFEQDPYIQGLKARFLAEGEVKGVAKGEILASQQMLSEVVAARFPALAEFAQHIVPRVQELNTLQRTAKTIALAPDEQTALEILNQLAPGKLQDS